MSVRLLNLLPPAYVVRREGNSFTLLVCPHLGGVPISHNALQHFPECHGADTWGGGGTLSGPAGGGGYPAAGGYPAGGGGGTLPVSDLSVSQTGFVPHTAGYPAPGRVPPRPGQGRGVRHGGTQIGYPPPRQGTTPSPSQVRTGGGGYPVRRTEEVLTTRRAVCLLRSRRRTFLLLMVCTARSEKFLDLQQFYWKKRKI